MKAIEAALALLEMCVKEGVDIELNSSKGEVKFKVIKFSDKEKAEGAEDCIAICDDSGKMI